MSANISTSSHSGRALAAIFASTLFGMSGIMMLSPLLLLLIKQSDVSTTVAALFAATSWLGIFLVTPFASLITRAFGHRRCLWLSTAVPLLTSIGFLTTSDLVIWFLLELIANIAGGLRWVLSESIIAELAPPDKMGRYIGMYATLMGLTFVIGPTVLAWVGTEGQTAFIIVIALLAVGTALTALIPSIQSAPAHEGASVGWTGLRYALTMYPMVMLAGFVGGYFELGLSSILPLVGLHLKFDASDSALLVAVSGLGSILIAVPAGMIADRFRHPERGRRLLMANQALLLLVSSVLLIAASSYPKLIWLIALVWGGAGGALYTLTMIDIAAREKGLMLVNSMSILVLSYTLGALIASSISGALIDWSAGSAFPAVLIVTSAIAMIAILWPKPRSSIR